MGRWEHRLKTKSWKARSFYLFVDFILIFSFIPLFSSPLLFLSMKHLTAFIIIFLGGLARVKRKLLLLLLMTSMRKPLWAIRKRLIFLSECSTHLYSLFWNAHILPAIHHSLFYSLVFTKASASIKGLHRRSPPRTMVLSLLIYPLHLPPSRSNFIFLFLPCSPSGRNPHNPRCGGSAQRRFGRSCWSTKVEIYIATPRCLHSSLSVLLTISIFQCRHSCADNGWAR